MTTANPAAQPLTIPAADGYPLAATLYTPAADNGRAVVINAAMAVRQRFYGKLAAYLAEQGFTVLTYDYRGVGGSAPQKMRGFEARLWEWGAKDFHAMLAWLIAEYPQQRLLVIGHSIGGHVVGLTPLSARLVGMFTAPAQSAYWRHWSGRGRVWVWLVWNIMVPLLSRSMGYYPGKLGGMGEDLPAGVVQEWAQATHFPRYLLDVHAGGAHDHFAAFGGRWWSWGFTDDTYAPRRAVEGLPLLYPNAQATLRFIDPAEVGAKKIGHFGFFREQFRDTLWAECAAWLAAQPQG